MIEWISVDDRLPDDDRDVIVWRLLPVGGEALIDWRDDDRGWALSLSPVLYWAEINPPEITAAVEPSLPRSG